MALANVASLFAARGLRVLMVDWDLEAPGLEGFFVSDANALESVQSRLGVIDLLATYKTDHRTLPFALPADVKGKESPSIVVGIEEIVAVLEASLPPLRPFLVPCVLPRNARGDGSLSLLPAGARAGARFNSYASAVQGFDWNDFYTSYHGEAYFEWLRRQLDACADVVLIDSRTGVTEMGGVCAQQLADVVVSFCAPNDQNVAGTTKMARALKRPEVASARGRELQVLIVPSRIDRSAQVQRNVFVREFNDAASGFLPSIFKDLAVEPASLQLPYTPAYSYEEKVIIGSESGDRELEDAYGRLAAHLAVLTPEGRAIRQHMSEDVARMFPTLVPRVTIAITAETPVEATIPVLAGLEREGISFWADVVAIGTNDTEASRAQQIQRSEHLVIVTTGESVVRPEVRSLWIRARTQGVTPHIVFTDATAYDPPALWLEAARMNSLAFLDSTRFFAALRESSGRARSPLMAPAVDPGWAERDEDVSEALHLSTTISSSAVNGRAGSYALVGPAGCGKTVLAAQACQSDTLLSAFPGGILWGSVAQGTLPVIGEMFAALTGDRREFASVAVAIAALSDQLLSRRALVVLDDVQSSVDFEPFLRLGPEVTLFIITRDHQVAGRMQLKLELPEAVPTDARAIITSQLVQRGITVELSDQPALERFVDWLGRSPALLTAASNSIARYRQQGSGTLSQTFDTLRETAAKIGVICAVADDDSTIRSLRAGVLASIDRLSPEDRTAFIKLAQIGSRPEFDVDGGALTLWGGARENRLATVARLGEASLVYSKSAGARFTLPSLVQAVLLDVYATKTGVSEATPSVKDLIATARELVRPGTSATADDLLAHAKKLKQASAFRYARILFERARDFDSLTPAQIARAGRELVFCTYKDVDLPVTRFDRAFALLDEVDPIDSSTEPETFGLAGAIYKQRWMTLARKEDLERSLSFYLRGMALGVEKDLGYCAINAAFLLDVLGSQQTAGAAATPSSATFNGVDANTVRASLINTLPPLAQRVGSEGLLRDWWFKVTVAEAYFGLRQYDAAERWLADARSLPGVAEWQLEATARQLIAIARLQDRDAGAPNSAAWRLVRTLVGNDDTAAFNLFRGKVGLALSGGGFRASLFHIGVLARMAECDVLRQVQVLSCVSGGSIIGAHYYLELRKLLQDKADADITRDDYVALIQRVADDFLAGVQRNIRARVMASVNRNLRVVFSRDYTRTHCLGELYESEIFSRVNDGEGKEPRWLSGLFIRPKNASPEFTPRRDNWRRSNKVPELVLNATTLNTGHSWQFTASWMGEPPDVVGGEIDTAPRLRRMYYDEAPDEHHKVRLGHAVAASSCVPGLFEPLALAGLFPNMTIRLVDGGVHDNQGTGSLLEESCDVMLVSDASGQLESLGEPNPSPLAVPLRANGALMARVRDAQYRELDARRWSTLLRGLTFLHLKKDLQSSALDWLGAHDPADPAEESSVGTDDVKTSYGVRRDVQAALAGIRTDLDSFSTTESYALMLSGYRMATAYLHTAFPEAAAGKVQPQRWRFVAVEDEMTAGGTPESETRRLLDVLDVGKHQAFRLFRLSPSARASALVVILGGSWWIAKVLLTSLAPVLLTTWVGSRLIRWIAEHSLILRSAALQGQPVDWRRAAASVGTLAAGLIAIYATYVAYLAFQPGRATDQPMHRPTRLFLRIGAVGVATIGWLVANFQLIVLERASRSTGEVKSEEPRVSTPSRNRSRSPRSQ